MTHNAVGAIAEAVEPHDALLAHDWYTQLNTEQLAAYMRYQFIYLNEAAVDWDARAHTVKRPAWDGGKDNFGVRHSSVWAKAARAIGAVGANPGMWVYAHFSPAAEITLAGGLDKMPTMRPAMLYSGASQKIYTLYCAEATRTIAHKATVAGHTINSRYKSTNVFKFSKADQTLYVLCDESYVSAPPFFRHAWAAAANCDSAIERYLWRAALDYEANQPLYDQVIKDEDTAWWVTDELRAAVRLIRDHWRTYNG
jgi:hypothetical protein